MENEIVKLMLWPWRDQDVNVPRAEKVIGILEKSEIPEQYAGIVGAYCEIMRGIIKLDQWERYMDMGTEVEGG